MVDGIGLGYILDEMDLHVNESGGNNNRSLIIGMLQIIMHVFSYMD